MSSSRVARLPSAAAGDERLVAELTDLVNDAFATSEAGMWVAGATRTTTAGMAEMVRGGQLVVAFDGERVAGCVRARPLGDGVGGLGMLAVRPEHRRSGIGDTLHLAGERVLRADGHAAAQVEVLVPRDATSTRKEFLLDWCVRHGYRVDRVGSLEEMYPELAPLLAVECDLVIHRKPLGA